MAVDAFDDFRTRYASTIADFGVRGDAARWPLSSDAVAAALCESVRSWTASRDTVPAEREVIAYIRGLRAEDLVLACACRLGVARAWECFVDEYRPVLRSSAQMLTHDPNRARDLADSLYAELYGIEERGGERRSLFGYFHGRSSLRTWLHAVLARRYLDARRAEQRTQPLDEAVSRTLETAGDCPDPERPRYVAALAATLTAALAELKPRDRMRLNLCYVEDLTLRQIGRVMNEHESSVSRRLARTRKRLRRSVERMLRRQKQLNDEQIQLCYDYSLDDWPFDLSRILSEPK